MKLESLTIAKIHQLLKEKKLSALELSNQFLEKIEKDDKKLSAFLTVDKELVLSQAKEADRKIKRKEEVSVLTGIPLAVKDNILVENLKCTAGSKVLKDYFAPYDATIIKKLKKLGVVILGKTNLDEFAMGCSTENSAFGPTKNPNDLTRVPGGSSGGSASAVAANMAVCALGSDTGGSVRLPAAFCGTVGFKPTYGAVSRYGLIAMASSLDQIGPLAKTVEDAQIIFDAIKGKDVLDSTSVQVKKMNYDFKASQLKIGIPKEYFKKDIDSKIKTLVKAAIKKYEDLGSKVEEISLPHCTDYALAAYHIINSCEVSTNLARYDGVRYGSLKGKSLMDLYLKNRGQGFGFEVKRRIMLGAYALSAGYYEAYYLRAQKVRAKVKEDFSKVFQKVDLILTPATPFLPFKFGEKKDSLSMQLSDIFMVAVNLAGLPAISMPCGKIDNLPVSFQIIGKPFQEEVIFKAAKNYERGK